MALTWPLPAVPALFLVGYLLAGLISMGFAAYIARSRRHHPAARAFAAIAVVLTIWSVAYIGRLLAPTLAGKLLWTQLAWIGITITPVAVLAFVLIFTGRGHYITRGRIALLVVIPIVTQIMLATNAAHGLFYADIWLYTGDSIPIIASRGGTYFYGIHIPYAWALYFVATVLLIQFAFATAHIYRWQVLALLVGALLPWIVNGTFLAGVRFHPELDPTPIGVAIGLAIIALAVFRVDFLGLVPVARERVIDEMADAVFVIDDADRLIDVNTAGEAFLETHGPADWSIGDRTADLFPAPINRAVTDPRAQETEINLSSDEGEYWCLLRRHALDEPLSSGHIIVITDITPQIRQRQSLTEANERLQQVTSVMSHDLRNPLTVASGRLELARETGDPEHLDHTERALNRMAELIDDILTLARAKHASIDPKPVSLADCSTASWANVATESATLTLETDRSVRADESRLKQLFENLFRNAVEHGGPDVTVTVGDLPDGEGIFVEDDGPGIPATDRAHVFDRDFSTRTDGTGFGLAIVAEIAKAHGWTIRATEGETGGARFEIHGITVTE